MNIMGITSLPHLVAAVLLVLTSSRHAQSQLACPRYDGEFPYPADCSRFIRCDAGVATLMRCPRDLEFNPARGYCDFYGSTGGCQRAPRVSEPAPSGTGQVINYEICGAAPNGGDPVNGFQVPHPTVCNAFFTCFQYRLYTPCTFCPEGSYFDSFENGCRSIAERGSVNSLCQGREFVAHDQKVNRQLDGLCRDIPRGRPIYLPATATIPSSVLNSPNPINRFGYVPGNPNRAFIPGIFLSPGRNYLDRFGRISAYAGRSQGTNTRNSSK